MTSRVFKLFQIAPCSLRKPNEFLCKQLAYAQLVAKRDNITAFVSGPHMEGLSSSCSEDYWSIGQKIESTLLYFMRPIKSNFMGQII